MGNEQENSFERIVERRFALFGAFLIILFATYGFFAAIDFLPEPKEENGEQEVHLTVKNEMVEDIDEADEIAPVTVTDGVSSDTDPVSVSHDAPTDTEPRVAALTKSFGELPKRIIIDELGTDVTVLNPDTRTIEGLDAALQHGVVRHPDSADLSDNGHMFLFGHSSYLPTVHNRNYQAFNGIQKLTWGDLVRVQSGDTEYIYRVVDSYEVQASQAEVLLDHSKARLTLATCDSFGSIDDRFVVEAELISSHSL